MEAVAAEIEVRLPGSSKRVDADIAKAAVEAIRWHVYLPEDKLRVKVEDGIVIVRLFFSSRSRDRTDTRRRGAFIQALDGRSSGRSLRRKGVCGTVLCNGGEVVKDSDPARERIAEARAFVVK